MAESEKGTSSVDQKKKSLQPDKEIGKDFLSSWKSMSVTENMDFSFEPISTGKKKAFNFEKLDMDFNLDSEFDKLSSFKMDMPDLDFSCPTKNSAKPKEKKSKESSSGKHQGEKEPFSFSFDFNELDGFNFDPSLIEGEKTCKKSKDTKAIDSVKNEGLGSKLDLALEDDIITTNLPALENVANLKVETLEGGAGARKAINDTYSLNATTSANRVVSDGSKSHEGKMTISIKKTAQPLPVSLSDRKVSSEPLDQQSLQNSPADSVAGNDSTQDTASHMQAQVCPLGTRVKTSAVEEENVNEKKLDGEGSNHAKLQCNILSTSLESDRGEKVSDDKMPTEIIDDTGSAKESLDPKDIFSASQTRDIPVENRFNKDIQNSTPKLHLVALDSEQTVSKLMAKEDKEAEANYSRFFRRPEETESQIHQPPSSGRKVSSFNKETIGAIHISHPPEKTEDLSNTDSQICRKMICNSESILGELTKCGPVLLGSKSEVKSLSEIREGLTATVVQNGSQLSGISRLQDKEMKEGEPVLLRREKDVSSQANSSSLTETITESNALVDPKSRVPNIENMGSAKIVSERLKTGKKTPDHSNLKILRTTGANKGLPTFSLRETNASRNLENKEPSGDTASMIVQPVGSIEKKATLTASLKRKTFEDSNTDLVSLKTLKRLSESPSESRTLEKTCKTGAVNEVCNHECNLEVVTTSGPEASKELNMTGPEVPLVIEDNGNVEKAEAYTKELDDICNMLKKKHEEAKEILVRAVVNNNNLLMLNHPLFDEKIRMAQRFAALLISKELPQ